MDPYYIRVAVAYNSNSKALEISNITMFNDEWQKVTGIENEKTATFKVKAETKADGYDAPKYKTNGKENVSNGTVVGGETDEVVITNNKGTTIDTGVFMNNLPYLLVLLFAAACGVGFVVSKKHGLKED